MDFSLYLYHVELSSLAFVEIVHELGDQSELFEGRGEDGVFTEVYFVFIDL
jgi:hypothetical protein